MRETSFIKQNKEKWENFEGILGASKRDPDRLSELFIQVTDDLAYAQTYYPNRAVRVYLNNLAQKVFYGIYKNKRINLYQFISFWKNELPQMLFESRKELLIALVFFGLSFLIGVVSSANDHEFYHLILGESYVTMTENNINSGDPMAVYKSQKEMDMFLGITLNNLLVAFRTFVSGLLIGIGSIALLIYNGIMVGTFQYFFYEKALLQESFLTIWMHGTLEISSIIISGGAGLVMGKGLVFPGTYSRLQSFRITAMRGVKIMLGITPIFIAAAFIEGFITRYTGLPDIIRLAVIFLSLLFILGYFVWYPIVRSRQGFPSESADDHIPPSNIQKIDYHSILNNGDIMINIFLLYKKNFKTILLLSFALAALYTTGCFFLLDEDIRNGFFFKQIFTVNLIQYFNFDKSALLFFFNTFILALIMYASNYLFIKDSQERKRAFSISLLLTDVLENIHKPLVLMVIVNLMFFIPKFSILVVLVTLPFILFLGYVWQLAQYGKTNMLERAIQLLTGNLGSLFGLFIISLLAASLYMLFLDSPLLWFYFNIFSWNFNLSPEDFDKFQFAFLTFFTIFSLCMVLPILSFSIGLFHHTLIEIKEAVWLKEEIKRVFNAA